ncbi:ABC transporter B family member 19-like [Cucumis melo var. makuwa]|uniref:ABC transporter B family member 19-like n=1 Tax=Cucumis melo var. makuwa TaxID=1194695 RepID=A0A5D3BY90_CUCMM|nr:ABC transporter B family member 19-like [Cucumis melo var. makuwa]
MKDHVDVYLLSQEEYAYDLLASLRITDSRITPIPLDSNVQLTSFDGIPLENSNWVGYPTDLCSTTGVLRFEKKWVFRFEKKGKLSPRFVGPFEILEQINPVAYRLALPPSFSTVHDVFHVSMLRKSVADPTHLVDFEPLQINENLSYEKQPVEILAREVKGLGLREVTIHPSFSSQTPKSLKSAATHLRSMTAAQAYPIRANCSSQTASVVCFCPKRRRVVDESIGPIAALLFANHHEHHRSLCSLWSPKTSFVIGVSLSSPKTRDVPTGLQIAHVWERASLGVEVEIRAEASWRMTRTLAQAPVESQIMPNQLLVEAKHLRDFRKYNPKTFDRSMDDPTKAQMWLTSVETIFSLRYAKQQELLNLEQGDMTVEQYDVVFDMLSRFVPDLVWTCLKMTSDNER